MRAIGRVTAMGAGVTIVKEGDRVAVPWLYSACGHCEYCLTAWETVCAKAEFGWRNVCLIYAGIHLVVLLPLYVFALPKEAKRETPAAAHSALLKRGANVLVASEHGQDFDPANDGCGIGSHGAILGWIDRGHQETRDGK
jgi:threonine dehydrogenase-like Zn-dependent dehydrogenase